jgi:hypothetical protein
LLFFSAFLDLLSLHDLAFPNCSFWLELYLV